MPFECPICGYVGSGSHLRRNPECRVKLNDKMGFDDGLDDRDDRRDRN